MRYSEEAHARIKAHRKRMKRNRRTQRKQMTADQKQKLQELTAALVLLPTIMTLSGAMPEPVMDVKFHESELWLSSPTKALRLCQWGQRNFSLDGKEIAYKNLLARIERRCPEYRAVADQQRQERSEQAAGRKQARLDAEAEAERQRLLSVAAVELEKATYVGSTELLASGKGWTRTNIKKLVGRPDKVNEYSVGNGAYRRDVVQHLWLRSDVAKLERICANTDQTLNDLMAKGWVVGKTAGINEDDHDPLTNF